MLNEHIEEEELLSKDDENSDQNDIFKDSTKISKNSSQKKIALLNWKISFDS